MEFLEWLRFGIGTIVLLIGLATFVLEIFGVYRFDFSLNRMHAAAIGDTLGIGICLLGLMIFSGLSFTTLKLLLVILFLWLASPVSSHLIARFEVEANDYIEKHCTIINEDLDPSPRKTAGLTTESTTEADSKGEEV